MKADKFINKFQRKKGDKIFEYIKREIKDVPITKDDWDFLYEEICYGDWDCANDWGLYLNELGYSYINCSKFADYMEDWKQDLIDDDEWNEYNQDFKEQFERILKLLTDNQGWDINFGELEK